MSSSATTSDYLAGAETNGFLDLSELDDTIENDEVIWTDRKQTTSTWRQLVPRLLIFLFIGLSSLAFTLSLAHYVLDIGLPRTLEDVKLTASHLDQLLQNSWTGYGSVTIVFSVLYLWQQAFSIPGSVLLNLLAGYLYGILTGGVLTSFLTAGGSTLAYGLSMLVGEPLIHIPWIARKAEPLHHQLERERRSGGLFWWLLFARLFPFSPYWLINLISPLLDIPVMPFFWSTVFGSMPYNVVCAQAGDVLNDLTSTSDIVTVSLVIKLLIVSFISLVPVIWGKAIQQWARKAMGLPIADDDDVEKSLRENDNLELIHQDNTIRHHDR
ncbi:snare associated Golgi protein-domain-containing protein [Choanephora cucurbitarum]|nr:snare associated Golgi protein-domain-containing protein [Choanephora cucurbitarum]